jgi:purine-binding chemotaxis protein CheW
VNAPKQQLCTFRVAGIHFGVDVLHVQEVIRFLEITEVPLAPRAVVGLINLRGEIVTAIDMRRRLMLPERAPGELPMNVVLRNADSIVSLLVDCIGDVLEVEHEAMDPPPETLDGVTREVVRAVYKLDDTLLLVLEANAVTGKGLLEAA